MKTKSLSIIFITTVSFLYANGGISTISPKELNITVSTHKNIIASNISDETTNNIAKENKIGQYVFKYNTLENYLISEGGFIDINDNGKIEKDDFKNFTMYANLDKTYINPFTTFKNRTKYKDNEIASLFGIQSLNMPKDDVNYKKALAYAIGLLVEVELNGNNCKPSTTPTPTPQIQPDTGTNQQVPPPLSNPDGETVLPFSVTNSSYATQNKYECILQNVFFYKNQGKSIEVAVAEVLKDNSYKALPFTSAELDTYINNIYKKYTNKEQDSSEPKEKTADGYTLVSLSNNTAKIPENANVILIDKIAFYKKTQDNFMLTNAKNNSFPPAPSVFSDRLKTQKKDSNYILTLSKPEKVYYK